MNTAEFEDLLDRLGDDISKWPVEQRRTAYALLNGSAEAQALLEEARALRGFLSPASVRASPGFADRIVEAALKQAPARLPPERVAFVDRLRGMVEENFTFARLAFLSVCFLAGIAGGFLHNTASGPRLSFEAGDFSAYLPGLTYTVD